MDKMLGVVPPAVLRSGVNAGHAASLVDAGNTPSDALQMMSQQQGAQGGNPNLK
jgi:hypothetical protein